MTLTETDAAVAGDDDGAATAWTASSRVAATPRTPAPHGVESLAAAPARDGLDRTTVIVPVLDAERILPATLSGLWPTAEVIVVDGGSADRSADLARVHGATVVRAPAGRGRQLRLGAERAATPWLLFLHADTCLDAAAWSAIADYVARPDAAERAGVFRLRFDDDAWQARVLEFGVRLRVSALALPYGDQGLLIHRSLYDRIGGYAPLPLMEDVDLVRRLGRSRLRRLAGSAATSAERWRRRGWLRQSLLNLRCLALFLLGASPERVARLYER